MIWQFINDCRDACSAIRHWFRAIACKDYYRGSHGLGMCFKKRGHGVCEWNSCPKRREANK